MKIYDELKARGLIAQVTDEELISNLINEGRRHFILDLTRQQTASCGTFHGALPDETSSDGREQANRSDWRRNRIHRGPIRKNRYAFYDDTGADPA